MQVTIKVNDGNQQTVETQSGVEATASAQATTGHTDGGAPSLNESSSTPSSGADQLNIGGPPQWLKDAITKSKGETTTASSNGTDPTSSDGGEAPSF